MSTDLVERLRARSSDPVLGHDYLWHAANDPLSAEAATALESLQSDVERLTAERDEAVRAKFAPTANGAVCGKSPHTGEGADAATHQPRYPRENFVECLREESAYLSQAKDFAGPLSVITSLSDAADALDLAEASLAAERRRVEELEKSASELRDWIELWDRVCSAADPDDRKEPPPWEEVRKATLPDWAPHATRSADGWAAYMEARLVLLVRGFVHALAVKQEG